MASSSSSGMKDEVKGLDDDVDVKELVLTSSEGEKFSVPKKVSGKCCDSAKTARYESACTDALVTCFILNRLP